MAPKKVLPPPSSSPITIGDCEVVVEANKFTCESDPRSIQISFPRSAKVKISVREETNAKIGNEVCLSKPMGTKGDEETVLACPDEYMFVLVTPKDVDALTKCYIQEALSLYMKELPAMKYAANTGKQSTFLEGCVSKGKYCTLLLISRPSGVSEEIIAAITYQIVPADTRYAEIPLAAVTSRYQNKGFGQFVYKELRKRLQNVGICTIFCWGDKESEGFWLKQGFRPIAEINQKGKARRLPVKADIRRALCFPGGSTLMLSHLHKDSLVSPANLLRSCSQLKPHDMSPLSANNRSTEAGPDPSCDNTPKPKQIIPGIGSSEAEESTKVRVASENIKLSGFSICRDSTDGRQDQGTSEGAEYNNFTIDAANSGGTDHLSGFTRGEKRIWEASLSSLKSKRVKGTHRSDCQIDLGCGLTSENGRKQLEDTSFLDISPADPLLISCRRSNAEDCRIVHRMTEFSVSGEPQPNAEQYRIMLMNMADENKRAWLTKVVENLGGVVTSVGGVSTHVVTRQVRQTLNFCNALCSGAWVVSPAWLKDSFREGRFIGESSYILHDEEYLLKYRTELRSAVLKARARPGALLKGYDVCIAAHVQPAVGTLSAIVQSAGGNILRRPEEVREASKTIYIACEEDMEDAISAIKRGIRTFSSDWLMNCVMRQEVDLEAPQFAESL